MNKQIQLASGTGASVVYNSCQICDYSPLEPALFLGYMPPVNQLHEIGSLPHEQPSYPAQLAVCSKCHLVQLSMSVDPAILFPPEYPYTSGTTKILRDNFAELYQESKLLLDLKSEDLVVDIGSNDGTLLSNFHNAKHRVLGIEPTDVGHLANEKGIFTLQEYFSLDLANKVVVEYGRAKIITAANVFAHIEDVHSVLTGISTLLGPDGVFISESHYLIDLLNTLQYDTIYHEHLRYYSLNSLKYLFEMHGLEIFHAKKIPTHGGSIRVYAGRKGKYKQKNSVANILNLEPIGKKLHQCIEKFRNDVALSKLSLLGLLRQIKADKARIYAISAPSRASTLVNYVGLDDVTIDCVVEIKNSLKIGKYLPGTLIPIIEESQLYLEQPEFALILSWHIAEELAYKIRKNGYMGKFISPLPEPRIL